MTNNELLKERSFESYERDYGLLRMSLLTIYEVGKYAPFRFSVESVDEKLSFAQFPYTSKDVINTSILLGVVTVFLSVLFSFISPLGMYTTLLLGMLAAVLSFLYPVSIFYTKRKIEYNEEMLKAIMRISTFTSMNTSMEYAIIETTKQLKGTLRVEFEKIIHELRIRQKNTLGDVLEEFTPKWNSINPVFVKSLRLLETAAMSPKEEMEEIIAEVLDTLILSYNTEGKRTAEDLAAKSKSLLAIGVLLPIISLMLLPLISVFLSTLAKPMSIIFMYNILFPTILLLVAMNFSSRRIQVDTIILEDSPNYQPTPTWVYILCLGIVGIFAIPTILHLRSINMAIVDSAAREYSFQAILNGWFLSLGIILALFVFSFLYMRRHKKLWNEVDEIEHDMPHLLQMFSTYLSLNRSVESIIPDIVDDYKTHGFKDHPIVKVFSQLHHKLKVSKENITSLTEKTLPKICPSKKFSDIFSQIIGFTDISQKSAGKAAKLVRKQLVSIYALDDYLKTMLAETVSLINITTSMLAPLLCAAAIIMSTAMVMSLTFITKQLEVISKAFGTTTVSSLGLVDITTIVPPTIIEVVVSVYLIELIIILSYFASNINIGNDTYQTMKALNSNTWGFVVFSCVLFIGQLLFTTFIFGGVLAT